MAALTKVAGYDTGAPADIATTALSTLAGQLSSGNQAPAGLEQTLSAARVARRDAYDGPTGLREQMKSIKEAARAQYGAQSPEYLAVKGIRV